MIFSVWINRLIFLFSVLGLILTMYLAYEYSLPTAVTCPIAGTGCETVRLSYYAKFGGISIPYLGILFYFTMALTSILHTTTKFRKYIFYFHFSASLAAFLFGVYLTYLEALVIHAYCFWCMTSFIISALVLIFSTAHLVIWRRQHE